MMYTIKDGEQLIAMIISHNHDAMGLEFFTPPEAPYQLAYMRHPAGKLIEPHVHNHFTRAVETTWEMLAVQKGRVRVDFYSDDHRYLKSCVLQANDVVLMAGGGHGFEVLEEVTMIEVRQGPHGGANDKTRFAGVDASQLIMELE